MRVRIAYKVLRVTAEMIETVELFSDNTIEFAFYRKRENEVQ